MPRKKDAQAAVLSYFEDADLIAAEATLGFVKHTIARRRAAVIAAPVVPVAVKKPRKPRGPNKPKLSQAAANLVETVAKATA